MMKINMDQTPIGAVPNVYLNNNVYICSGSHSFSCHIMDSVKDKVKENNTDMVVVPGGYTKYIQAPDVCWNAPFKELVL